jgi:6-phosphogluconolactonase (cycloisomerase 2 family)
MVRFQFVREVAAAAVLSVLGALSAVASSPAGYVYTIDNDVAKNAVAVFARHTDGSLSEVAGSPFMAGGRGLSGGDIDEQGAIRVAGPFVLAVNPGSDSIAVFTKCNDGKLTPVAGSPFHSGGCTPLSLAVSGDMVYVANQAAPFANPKTDPNVTGFRLMTDGRLMPVAGATITFPKGQGPAQVELCPKGDMLAVTSGFQAEDGSRLHVYKVMTDGKLKPLSGSPATPMGASGTVGFSWGMNGDKIYLSNFRGSAMITFDVNRQTGMVKQMGEPLTDDQRAACWTAITRDGRTLYVANFVSNSVSVYDINARGMLSLLGSVPRRGATGMDTKDLEVSPDGKFLYVVGSGKKEISVFQIGANRLPSELPECCSPMMVRTGQNITGLAVE